MKKSFTFKAFAFGAAATVALAASAAPFEFAKLETEATMPVATKLSADDITCQLQMMRTSEAQAAPAKAPAKATPNYGEWTTPADPAVYTFVQRLSSSTTRNTKEAEYTYQVREDQANAGGFEAKIANFGSGVFANTFELDLVVAPYTYDGETKLIPTSPIVAAGFDASYSEDGVTTKSAPVYHADYMTWLRALVAAGEEISEANINSWASLYSYDATSGTAEYMPVYFLQIDGKPSWYTMTTAQKNSSNQVVAYYTETFRRTGPGFVYHDYTFTLDNKASYFSKPSADATNGYYKVNYNMHENTAAYFQILSGRKTGTTLNKALQTLVNTALSGTAAELEEAGIVKTTAPEGVVNVPISSYKTGQYTLLFIYQNPSMETGNVMGGSNNSLKLNAVDLPFYDAGTATYTEAFLPYAMQFVFGSDGVTQLGIPNEPANYAVDMQASADGVYRLVHPHYAYFTQYLDGQLDYDNTLDFLAFNTEDLSKCYINPSPTGIFYNTQSGNQVMITVGSTNKYPAGNAAAADLWGTYADGAVTFPAITDTPAEFDPTSSVSALSFDFGILDEDGVPSYEDEPYASPYAGYTKIVATCVGTTGIETVAADAVDANAPVVYYNLQGQRIAAPEAGQLVIKVQGNKAEKLIVR